MKDSRYWDGVIKGWLVANRDALWRRYNDALHTALFRRWLNESVLQCLLKTDLFDEAVGEGLGALSAGAGLAVGIDLSLEVASTAQQRHAEWHTVVADVRRLPFADGAFDAILSNSTLDHFGAVREIELALRELRRVLRPGGRLLLTLDNAVNPILALRHALPGNLLRRLGLVPYAVGVTVGPRHLCEMLTGLSFCPLEILPVLHVPRFFAVLAARRLAWASPARQGRFLNRLATWERLGRLPSRWFTGYFIAALAIKIED